MSGWREGALLEANDPAAFARLALGLFDQAASATARAEVMRVGRSSPSLMEIAGRLGELLDGAP